VVRSVLDDRHVRPDGLLAGPLGLPGLLYRPKDPFALVIFAHGSGSSRHSIRNRQVAEALARQGMATLLFDLLRPQEEAANARAKVFDIGLLAERLEGVIGEMDRFVEDPATPVGLFGASTGAAAALVAGANLGNKIAAIVCRGGRPDLAGAALPKVTAPTLLIVGGEDRDVLALNRQAQRSLRNLNALEVVPGATHLFPESGAMERVVALTLNWFERYLSKNPV
jgi:putative phosphoribosyl transferase